MLPRPMSRSEPSANDLSPVPKPDLARLLEQHVQSGFPPDLALDLVLNELVVRAAGATHASAAALALVRGDQMVCRAATGLHAPDLGVPLNTRDGLSGACVRTRTPQLSADTEDDPRIDSIISRRLGIRSMLIVPVFDEESDSPSTRAADGSHIDPRSAPNAALDSGNNVSEIRPAHLAGVLEVFSPLPNAFSQSTQTLLEDFARECARIRRAAAPQRAHPPAEVIQFEETVPLDEQLISENLEALSPDTGPDRPAPGVIVPAFVANESPPLRAHVRQPYEAWTLILGAIVIFAAAAVSFMIGSRIGWLRPLQPATTSGPSLSGASSTPPAASPKSGAAQNPTSPQTKPAPKTPAKSRNGSASSSDELVIYDKGKVIFRMNPAPQAEERTTSSAHASESARDQSNSATSETAHAPAETTAPLSSSNHVVPARTIWLAPAQAESRLLSRVEPQYPADALSAHRSGDVTLEVQVAADGTVASVRTLTGDPLLAAAAAQAVRNWRYQPYRLHDKPSPFQTDVTLTFSLPN